MSKEYKDIIDYSPKKGGLGRRRELAELSTKNADIQLDTLLLEDYDIAFKEWVEKELKITFEKKELPTVGLFATQRFGEYMQSWKHTDDKKNFLMNFKVITRESNPKPGTMYGDTRNVPENKFFLINRIESVDENGRPLFLDYKMRQPYCVDIVYKVSIITNKYRLLNQFNEIVNDKFKAINTALNVKGNFVTIILSNISDDSEYQIDDRQYYSQTYDLTVRGYLIRKEDYKLIESPKLKSMWLDNSLMNKKDTWAEIEDTSLVEINGAKFRGVEIKIKITGTKMGYHFIIDESFKMTEIKAENLVKFLVYRNNKEVMNYSNVQEGKSELYFKEGDEVEIKNIKRLNYNISSSTITLMGYNPDKTF